MQAHDRHDLLEGPQRQGIRPIRQAGGSAAHDHRLPENAAISSSERPGPRSKGTVFSPTVAIRLAADTLVPDMRNGRFNTLNVPPPSSTSDSAPRCAICGSFN